MTGHATNSPTPICVATVRSMYDDYTFPGNKHSAYCLYFSKDGIALHDASEWRTKFGGNIYKTNGSNGCVNLPLELSRIIYENATVKKTTVVVYQ